MSKHFNAFLSEIDCLIREAKGGAAQKLLKSLKKKDIPEGQLHEVATLAARANLPELGLALLHAIIYPSKRFLRPASGNDRAAYAMALIRLGAHAEAQQLLRTVSVSEVPRVLSYQAILCMKDWKYRQAISLLVSYLQVESDGYFRTNALTLLVQCLIFAENYTEAERFLNEIILYTTQKEMPLQKSNALRFIGIISFMKKDFSTALAYLQQSEKGLSVSKGMDYFFSRKWSALAHYLHTQGSPESARNLQKIENEAKGLRHWETVRDIHYHKAIFHYDKKTLLKLYFGTPFHSFRERLVRHCPRLSIPSQYLWELGSPSKQDPIYPEGCGLKSGMSIHRLFVTLLSDFYRPFNLVTLFEKLYPGGHYVVKNSDQRVSLAIRRTREFFVENQLPLRIDVEEGEFRLNASKSAVILIGSEGVKTITPNQHRLELLQKTLAQKVFSTNEAAAVLNLSRRAAGKLIQVAVEQQVLSSVGKGSNAKYQFTQLEFKLAG